jgi:hypothetical protein
MKTEIWFRSKTALSGLEYQAAPRALSKQS